MLVRLLGKEDEALNGEWDIPFTDLKGWEAKYVGYAYANGLTKGTGETTFGGQKTVSSTQYLTFVLRALGYDDTQGDFEWNNAYELAYKVGLTEILYDANTPFNRGVVAQVSENALRATLNGCETTLIEKLVASGVVNEAMSKRAGFIKDSNETVQGPSSYYPNYKAYDYDGQKLTIYANRHITFPTYAKEGCVLAGWQSSLENGSRVYESGSYYSTGDSSVTFIPVWTNNIYHVGTVDELLSCIKSDSVIFINPGEYCLSDWISSHSDYTGNHNDYDSNDYYEINSNIRFEYYYEKLIVNGIDDCLFVVSGMNSTTIETEYSRGPVIALEDCTNDAFVGVTFGHNLIPGTCQGSVIIMDNCSNIVFNECDIYGCGLIGIEARNVDELSVYNTIIHDCTFEAVSLNGCGNVTFNSCTLKDCYKNNSKSIWTSLEDYYILQIESGNITFEDCVITHRNASDKLLLAGWSCLPCNIIFRNCSIDQVLLSSIEGNNRFILKEDKLEYFKAGSIESDNVANNHLVRFSKDGLFLDTDFYIGIQYGGELSTSVSKGANVSSWVSGLPNGLSAQFLGIENNMVGIRLIGEIDNSVENGYYPITITMPSGVFILDSEPYMQEIILLDSSLWGQEFPDMGVKVLIADTFMPVETVIVNIDYSMLQNIYDSKELAGEYFNATTILGEKSNAMYKVTGDEILNKIFIRISDDGYYTADTIVSVVPDIGEGFEVSDFTSQELIVSRTINANELREKIFTQLETKENILYLVANGGVYISKNQHKEYLDYYYAGPGGFDLEYLSSIIAMYFVRDGYILKGWNTKSDGSGAFYQTSELNEVYLQESILFAQWEKTNDVVIRIVASSVPHADILEIAAENMPTGYSLQIIQIDNYIDPNYCIDSGGAFANFFQHEKHMSNFNKEFGTDICSIAAIHYEPMGIYAGKASSLDNISTGAGIAVPNDRTNLGRALLLLQEQGIIGLDPYTNADCPNKHDIIYNPYNIEIYEVESSKVSDVRDDVDYVILNGNFALAAGLSIKNDALAVETNVSDYVNVLCVKSCDLDDVRADVLIEALTCDAVKTYIENTYSDEIVCVF